MWDRNSRLKIRIKVWAAPGIYRVTFFRNCLLFTISSKNLNRNSTWKLFKMKCKLFSITCGKKGTISSWLKFMFSKKATKFDKIFIVDLTLCKGQTNSKWFLQADVSSKKTNKQIRLYYLSTCFRSFFGRKWRQKDI